MKTILLKESDRLTRIAEEVRREREPVSLVLPESMGGRMVMLDEHEYSVMLGLMELAEEDPRTLIDLLEAKGRS